MLKLIRTLWETLNWWGTKVARWWWRRVALKARPRSKPPRRRRWTKTTSIVRRVVIARIGLLRMARRRERRFAAILRWPLGWTRS